MCIMHACNYDDYTLKYLIKKKTIWSQWSDAYSFALDKHLILCKCWFPNSFTWCSNHIKCSSSSVQFLGFLLICKFMIAVSYGQILIIYTSLIYLIHKYDFLIKFNVLFCSCKFIKCSAPLKG